LRRRSRRGSHRPRDDLEVRKATEGIATSCRGPVRASSRGSSKSERPPKALRPTLKALVDAGVPLPRSPKGHRRHCDPAADLRPLLAERHSKSERPPKALRPFSSECSSTQPMKRCSKSERPPKALRLERVPVFQEGLDVVSKSERPPKALRLYRPR